MFYEEIIILLFSIEVNATALYTTNVYTRALALIHTLCVNLYIYPAQSFDSRESPNNFCGRAPNKKCTCTVIRPKEIHSRVLTPEQSFIFRHSSV